MLTFAWTFTLCCTRLAFPEFIESTLMPVAARNASPPMRFDVS